MSNYQYSSLNDSQLRILTLLPGNFEDPLTGLLVHHQFLPANAEIPKYEALSYVWGDQTKTEPIAISQGHHQAEVLIGASLTIALRHLRQRNQPRYIWCDSICINQENLIERAAQVLRMGEIYQEAARVVVWLGPEEDDSSLALNILDHIGSNIRFNPATWDISPLPGADQKFGDYSSVLSYQEREWSAIENLFARSWFKRLWVRQEIVLAKSSAIVVVGHSATTWLRFGQASGCIEVKIALGATNCPFSTRLMRNITGVVALYRTMLFKHPVALLNFTRSCQCKDDRDRVYSLLGLINPSYRIRPDYSRSVKAICKEFMLCIYREDARLDILAFCDITTSPSWIPNLPGPTPANHFWRNFATGYYKAHLKLMLEDKIEVFAISCGVVLEIMGYIPIMCAADELKERVKSITVQKLGGDPRKWEDEMAVKLTQALLGGHWFENTNHEHDPPLAGAVSVLKNWVLEDAGTTNGYNGVLDMLVNWATTNTLSGWSVYQTECGLFGICSPACLPGDQIYAVLGCKDPIILRQSEGYGYRGRVVGPTYVYNFSCGQALGKDQTINRSFVGSFNDLDIEFEKEDGLGKKGHLRLQHIDLPHEIDDYHPIWDRRRNSTSSTQNGSSLRLKALLESGLDFSAVIFE